MKLACQDNAKLNGKYEAVAIVVEGGSVSRVEAHCMHEIVRCVKVFGEDGAPVDCDITILRYTQANLFAEWVPYVGQPSVRKNQTADHDDTVPKTGRDGSNLEFAGNMVYTQLFFVASFPGIYEGIWKRMTEEAKDFLACACVFFKDEAGGVNGKHAGDKRGCRCDHFARCAPDQARPQTGTTFTNWKGEQQRGSWDGNKPSWGCRWAKLWECNVEAALACEQLPIVVYQTDREFDGVTGVHMGLGNAQYGARLHNYNT